MNTNINATKHSVTSFAETSTALAGGRSYRVVDVFTYTGVGVNMFALAPGIHALALSTIEYI